MSAALALLALLSPAALAEEESSPMSLGVHRFVLPATLDDPFPVSSMTFRQGATYSRAPEVYAEGYETPFELALLGAAESLAGSARLSDRLGLYGEVQGQVFTGLNADSAFFVGGRAGGIWELGGVGVLLRSEEKGRQLGLRLKARGTRGLVVEPEGLVTALLEEREETMQDILEGSLTQHIFRSERSRSLGASLCYAQSLTPMVGLLASAQFRGGTITRTGADGEPEREDRHRRLMGSGGLAADIDIAAPLAFQTEVRYRADTEDSPESYLSNRWYFNGGIYYDGRPELRLGLVTGALLARGDENREQSFTAELMARYLF